jgi:hypothetical protein
MQLSSGQVERTTTGTFRVAEDVYAAMQKEAEEKRVSLNCLVNQVLHEHVFEPVPFMNSMFVAMPKSLYTEFLSRVTEDDAKQIGVQCSRQVAKSLMLAKHGSVTSESIAEALRSYSDRAGYGRYNETSNGGKRIITIMHEFGPKHSASTAAHAESLYQLIGLKPRITTTDQAVIIEV